jgi:hypothetical protein
MGLCKVLLKMVVFSLDVQPCFGAGLGLEIPAGCCFMTAAS